jgi:hypothetical protein
MRVAVEIVPIAEQGDIRLRLVAVIEMNRIS